MLVDTHCHLNFKAFNKDLSDVVRRAREAGIEKMIIPGTDLASSRRAVEIACEFPGSCFAAVGIHPHHAQDPNLKVNASLRQQLEKLIAGEPDKIVAIGEIGLDNYRYQKTKYENSSITAEIKNKQRQLLKLQLDLAVIHNLPVILHCRQAYNDLIKLLENFSRTDSPINSGNQYIKTHQSFNKSGIKPERSRMGQLCGVFHCFSGSSQDLQTALSMGYYIGFDGNITYSKTYKNLVASTPLERLLLETDSPYLTPIPHRGTRNEPTYLPLVAQAVADYHDTSLSQVAQKTNNNTKKLFRI